MMMARIAPARPVPVVVALASARSSTAIRHPRLEKREILREYSATVRGAGYAMEDLVEPLHLADESRDVVLQRRPRRLGAEPRPQRGIVHQSNDAIGEGARVPLRDDH